MLLSLLLLLGQEDLDARLEALAAKLAKDPASAALAELCGGELGRAAIRERVDALVNHRAGRLDRDPLSRYEELLFKADGTGALHVRPEAKEDVERLAKDVASAHTLMASFNRRVFELTGRLQGDGELEKKARGWWTDSTFRVAFFLSRADDLRDRDFLQEDPGLDVLKARLERIPELEKAYLKNLAGLEDAARQALVTETATLFIVGRLLRQTDDGAANPVGELAEGDDGQASLAFAKPLTELLGPLKDLERTLQELQAWFAGRTEEDFKNPKLRVLFVESLLGRRQEQTARAEAVFAELLKDGFEEDGGALKVKKGRYVGENNADSPGALDAEYKGVVDGYRDSRRGWDAIAELCADPKLAWTFASPPGTLVLQEHLARRIAVERRAIEERGYEFFEAFYLEKAGDGFAVRPAHAAKVHDMVRRAAEILKERSGQ